MPANPGKLRSRYLLHQPYRCLQESRSRHAQSRYLLTVSVRLRSRYRADICSGPCGDLQICVERQGATSIHTLLPKNRSSSVFDAHVDTNMMCGLTWSRGRDVICHACQGQEMGICYLQICKKRVVISHIIRNPESANLIAIIIAAPAQFCWLGQWSTQ